MSDRLAEHRREVAPGCRVLAARGLSPGFRGHVSLRVVSGVILVRGRSGEEQGLLYTVVPDIQVVSGGVTGDRPESWSAPNELPIHSRIHSRRSDVQSVVYCHPQATAVADLAGMTLLSGIGAYDIPGAMHAVKGLPVYPRSMFVNTDELGDKVAKILGVSAALVMRGHGLTTTDGSVAEAVLRAIAINELFQIMLDIRSAGGQPEAIPDEDLARLPDLGASFNTGVAWRHELAHLACRPGLGDLDGGFHFADKSPIDRATDRTRPGQTMRGKQRDAHIKESRSFERGADGRFGIDLDRSLRQ